MESLLKHRQMREATILTELRNGPSTVREIAERLGLDPLDLLDRQI